MLKGKRIFVIEDDPTNLAIISTILRRYGASTPFDVWGSDTTQKIKDLPSIDLILLDLHLPGGVHGYDIFDEIKQVPELKDIPIVVVTASDSSIEMNKAREKGLDGFISKPISYKDFGQQVADVLDGKSVWVSS